MVVYIGDVTERIQLNATSMNASLMNCLVLNTKSLIERLPRRVDFANKLIEKRAANDNTVDSIR